MIKRLWGQLLCFFSIHDWRFASIIPGRSELEDRHLFACNDCSTYQTRTPDWRDVLPDDRW